MPIERAIEQVLGSGCKMKDEGMRKNGENEEEK